MQRLGLLEHHSWQQKSNATPEARPVDKANPILWACIAVVAWPLLAGALDVAHRLGHVAFPYLRHVVLP